MGIQNPFNNIIYPGYLKAKNGVQGDIFYLDSSGVLQVLPISGTPGSVLGISGGIPAWQVGAAPSGNAGGDFTGTYPNPTIANNAVTLAKLQDIATASFLGRSTAATGDPEVLSVSAAKTLLAYGTAANANTGTANGNVPVLDANGYLPTSTIPPLRSHEFVTVANQAARLALTSTQVQPGDEAFQTDTGRTYKLLTTDPSQNANWQDTFTGQISLGQIPPGTNGQYIQTSGGNVVWGAAGGGSAWMTIANVSGTSQAMAVNTVYYVSNAALCTLTLPSTAAQGDRLSLRGYSTGGMRIAQNVSQQIFWLNDQTTSGVTGRVDTYGSENARAAIDLECHTANNGWMIVSASGTLQLT